MTKQSNTNITNTIRGNRISEQQKNNDNNNREKQGKPYTQHKNKDKQAKNQHTITTKQNTETTKKKTNKDI